MYYDTEKECLENKYTYSNTNSRYKNYCQDIFTAGDQEQFYSKVNINDNSIYNTFKYIFCKFKKGIFVVIKNNKVDLFLPFDNNNFINEYEKYIDFSNAYKLINKISYKKQHIKPFINWYSNNGIFRYEYQKQEIDKISTIFYNMFTELCDQRKIKDCYFFINRRDFPILKHNLHEAYTNIFGNIPLLSHKYDKYCPIFSMTSNNEFQDISIPTWDDWVRVSDKYFPFCCKKKEININNDFDNKIPTAIFRGSSTGIGCNSNNNIRLKLANMESPIDNGIPLFDAGITKINKRIRKDINSKQLQIITENIKVKDFMSFEEQTNYKYIINVDGYVSAFRLSNELSSKSVILLNDSEFTLWFRNKLIPFVHYIPIKNDLSDLVEQIRWCKNNNDKCKQIINNAYEFYLNEVNKDSILNYLQKQCNNISKKNKYSKDIKSEINHYISNKIKYNNININIDNYKLLSNTVNSSIFIKDNHLLKISNNNIHELFIYQYCLNKVKYNNFPKLIDTFMYNDKPTMIIEKINGITLSDFLKNKFNIILYLDILIQITKLYSKLYEKYNFIHYDCYPWNIIIKYYDEKTLFIYDELQIESKVKPYIIDFDKTHIKYRNKNIGNVKIKGHYKFQDILTFIFNTFYLIIINNKLSKRDIYILYRIIDYFKGNNIYFDNMRTIKEIKDKCNSYKKFDFMINSDFSMFNDYNFDDFINYISNLK